VPFLWRFHAVHHSTEQMDWVAAGRLHPLDSAFTQACYAFTRPAAEPASTPVPA
jgi:sterol desaturase/sphingolipid hydroxylase (fatty acid hydroxylase superfamily)